ncbi:MAG TPA: molybdenum cofactor biosynthesis protein MoaE [Terriglobales bacterium]|nr:molybdenum cofactor biosynthesis protein MoaE [Terriglobales bacterium]
MEVRVLFFGILKDVVGRDVETLHLEQGSTLADVLAHYERMPGMRNLLSSLAVSINYEYAGPEATLNAQDEIALLPPVSGGAADLAQDTSARRQEHEAPGQCAIVRLPIETNSILTRMKAAEDGAAVVFEGIVRNHTRGRRTLYLEYEAYEPMALKQMQELSTHALQQLKIRDLAIVHRLGRLEIGETSVLIVVTSAHRGPAFEACRWVIDTLKRTVPIWKKEYFEDGAVWADGESFPPEIVPAQGTAAIKPASK